MPLLARMLLTAALLGGIVTMHAVAVNVGHVSVHTVTSVDQRPMGGHPNADQPCNDGDCGTHSGFHACVFVMTATCSLAGLALLYWVATGGAPLTIPELFRRLRRRPRAPPWTVLSVSQLSILRV